MQQVKVTAIIPTFNAENTIENALKSILWANEILIVDSFSTDKTLEIAKKYTHSILQHEYINSSAQKNWIIPQASNEWIFLLDSDEVASKGLIEEIKSTLSGDLFSDAYWVSRENHFMGKKLKFVWRGDKVIRLFKKDLCRYQDLMVHAEIETTGSVGMLKHKITHYSYQGGLQRHLKKLDIYTTWGAYDRVKKGERITFLHLIFKPFYRFIRHYIFFLGFLDGKVGFIVSVFSSYTVFLRSLKIWRIRRGEFFDPIIKNKNPAQSDRWYW